MNEIWALEITEEGEVLRATCLEGDSAPQSGNPHCGDAMTAVRRIKTILRDDEAAADAGAWFRLQLRDERGAR